MEFFRISRDIPFMRHAKVLNAISLVTFIAAVFFLATRGLHFSIEFTGGTLVEVSYAQAADVGKTRGVVEGEIAAPPAGAGGFGYDPVFFVPEAGKTLAELTADEKNRVSHRRRALDRARTIILAN
mgnify:CR=1 FL=1